MLSSVFMLIVLPSLVHSFTHSNLAPLYGNGLSSHDKPFTHGPQHQYQEPPMKLCALASAEAPYSSDEEMKSRNKHEDNDSGSRRGGGMSFEQRMRQIALERSGNGRSAGSESTESPRLQRSGKKGNRPSNLRQIESLEDYKKYVGEEREKITVVRFYATWCKSCRAMAPGFYRLASEYPNVNFVDVPVTNKNVDLHQGLEVPSVPFGHIYHPTAGLVEEMKISKKFFHKFHDTLNMYTEGICKLLDVGDCTSPFDHKASEASGINDDDVKKSFWNPAKN